ncbi:Lipocalin-like protein [Flavobacterium sp. 9AF]|uniref:lipocalin family protein n=1 Tax=Flavobacterium sp. 9AF TaxID=2653142 RepID=UPI0012F35170|nr:lipocalin family protein [Flavobacterium sp. 9AF]VXB74727.1 Lipocalin-like protein [Flavobacterium sp. 9AF]
MKKFKSLFVFILMFSIVLVSCNKDDDASSVSIEGKWEYYKEGYINNNSEILIDYQNDCSNQKDFVEILSGSVIKTHVFEIPFQSTTCQEAISTGTWSKNENSVVITFSGESTNNEILELSDQYLKVKYYDENEQQYAIYIFKRI